MAKRAAVRTNPRSPSDAELFQLAKRTAVLLLDAAGMKDLSRRLCAVRPTSEAWRQVYRICPLSRERDVAFTTGSALLIQNHRRAILAHGDSTPIRHLYASAMAASTAIRERDAASLRRALARACSDLQDVSDVL